MKEINEILRGYTAGEITLEDANAKLKEAGASFHLDPDHNKLTEADLKATYTGDTPRDANGFGLLDTGTGSLDKVFVEGGKLADADCGDMPALCIIDGRVYHVRGDVLTD